jgi:V/A-type H+-transporting ATPase subunit I
MAVARMEKIQILAHRDVRERLIERIQGLERLHITDIRDGVIAEDDPDLVCPSEMTDEPLERRISQIQFTLDFLSGLDERKGLLSGILSPKIILTSDRYQRIVEEYDEEATVSRCRRLEREKTELLSTITKLEGMAEQLRPWLGLDSPLDDAVSTDHVAIYLGVLPVEALGDLHDRTSDFAHGMAVETVYQDRESAYLLVCLHQEIHADVWDLLKRLGFEEISFSGVRGKPKQAYEEVLGQIEAKRQRIGAIDEESKGYLHERQDLQVLYDHLSGQLQRTRVQANFGQTEKVCVIEGWIPAHEMGPFETKLTKEFEYLAIRRLDPVDRETPPISLENSKTFVRPFEVVTELYGLPNAREFDPSPLLAPFFFVFFGLCITDAAYGIIITLMFLFLMKKFKVTLGRAKLVGLLFFGGISTILMGAITGGWFGDLVEYLPPWLDRLRTMRESLMLFDPMEQVLVFIGIAILLGFGQICYGLGIRMVRRIREGDVAGAFGGPFPWLTLLNGLVVFGLSKGGVFSASVGSMAKWVALLSALGIVLFSDRTSRSWFARIAWGIYGLYGITSYVGDVLSYLRLFALGLATGIIAMVVNLLADMLGGAPYVGWLLFAIVFVVGHAFNILINGLGAFVHTLRLQYVEFFPKFFEGGGKPYQPFQREARYTILTEDKGR